MWVSLDWSLFVITMVAPGWSLLTITVQITPVWNHHPFVVTVHIAPVWSLFAIMVVSPVWSLFVTTLITLCQPDKWLAPVQVWKPRLREALNC